MNIQKCAIVGCGAVGATAAYTLLGSGLFNELVLIDINQKKAEGEAMDIGHGVPFIHPVEIYAGTYEDLADAYLVIVTAGANQLPGESRINLTEKNVRIFQSIIPEIVRYNTECLLLIVANPVDILTYITYKISGFSTGESYRQRNSTGFFQVQVPSGRVYRYRPPQCSCIYYWGTW